MDLDSSLGQLCFRLMQEPLFSKALFDEFENLRSNRVENPMILVTSTPRSSATYFTRILGAAYDLNAFRYGSTYLNIENELYPPALCIMQEYRGISIAHMKACYSAIQLIKLFGIKTIVMTRNIIDSVVSIARWYRRNSEQRQIFSTGFSCGAQGWLDSNIYQLSDDQLLDLVIELFLPWYYSFYASWKAVIEAKEIDVLWITYEDLKTDIHAKFQDVIQFCGFSDRLSKEKWTQLYNDFPPSSESLHGMNDLKSHHDWKSLLTYKQMDRIKKFTEYYPGVDFTQFGL